MTQRNVGEVLDEIVAYSYAGLPVTVTEDRASEGWSVGYFRRPRLAAFRFSSYMRTPVHDLPHDGVGVVAMHRDDWHALLRAYQDDLPSGIDLVSLYGIAVEQW